MLEIMKMIKLLLAKGFATAEEKAAFVKSVDELEKEEEKEALADDAAKVDELPEEDPKPKEDAKEDEAEVAKMIGNMLEGKVKEIKESVENSIDKHVKTLEASAEKRMSLYNDAAKTKRVGMNEYIRNISKEVLAGNDIKLKEMTTDATDSPYAGYTVDSELSAEVRSMMTEYGVARREFMSIQLSKNSYKLNELVTDIVVYWVDEAGDISSNQVVLGQNTLELKKLAVIVSMTNELLEDEEIDLFDFVARRVAQAFSREEDEEFFTGDGTVFTGILELSSTVNIVTMSGSTFASITADDFLDMVDATPEGALANGKFYMNRTVMSLVRTLKTTTNEYIYQKPSENGPATLWGYPIVFTEVMPKASATAAATAFVIFGDLKQGALFGYKGGLRVSRYESGSVRNVADSADLNLLMSDRQAVRWIERVGWVQIITTLDKPITILKTAAASA